VIGAISAVTAILISVGIVVLIVLKHKSSQVEREYKRIQIQMDLVRITPLQPLQLELTYHKSG
jgi:hypothetical protein